MRNRWVGLLLILTIFILLPILIIGVKLFTPFGETFRHLVDTVLKRYLFNTLVLTSMVSLITITIGTTLSWFITRYDFRGQRFFEVSLALPLVIPPYIMGFTYSEIFDYTGPIQSFLRNSMKLSQDMIPNMDILNMQGVIWIISLSFYPYVYLMVKSSMKRQSMGVIEMGALYGYSPFKIFWKLILPLSRPAIVAGVSLVIMETLNDYGTVKYFGVDTFSTGIFRTWFSIGDKDASVHLASFLLLFVLIILIVEKVSRRSARYDFSSLSYSPMVKIKLRGYREVLVILFNILVLSAGFFIPVLQNLIWLWETRVRMFSVKVFSTLGNTLLISFSSVVVIMLLALFLSYTYRLFTTRSIYLLNRVATIGYAIPGAIIALGVMIIFTTVDKGIIGVFKTLFSFNPGLIFTQSLLMLLFALTVRFVTVGYNSIDAGFSKIPQSINEASRSLGYTPLKTLVKVELPLLISAIISGGTLVFMELIKELPLSLILRPFNFETLATKAYEYATDEMVRESSFFSIMIILLGVISLIIINSLPKLIRKKTNG